MNAEQEQKVLASLYDRLYDAVCYAPDGKSGAFPKNIYFQMTKNTVLDPADFNDMISPAHPEGDTRGTAWFQGTVDAMPKPGTLWSDSGQKVSDLVKNVLAQANTQRESDPGQVAAYKDAYDYLNTVKTTPLPGGKERKEIVPSEIAQAYDDAKDEYTDAVMGLRTAYNGYDLTKKEDQRTWNAVQPGLKNLVEKTWKAWGRAGKEAVEEAYQTLASSINNAVSHAIDEQKVLCGAGYSLPDPSDTTGNRTFLPSYGTPSSWADPAAKGIKLSFKSDYLNKTESSSAHTYGLEVAGSYGLFHGSGEVEGKHVEKNAHMNAENLTLEAELMAVNIVRPWFNPLLLGMNSWWVRGYEKNQISNGNPANPMGTSPLIPVGFVVARNVSIAADFSSEDKKFVSDAVSSKLSAGWGPFTVSAKYGYSSDKSDYEAKFDGGKLIFPGLQLIAWISTVTPASPPMSAPVREPAKPVAV